MCENIKGSEHRSRWIVKIIINPDRHRSFFIDKIKTPTFNLFVRLPEMYRPSIMRLFYKTPFPGRICYNMTYIWREIYDTYSIKLRKFDFRRNGNPSWIMHDFLLVDASSMFICFIEKYEYVSQCRSALLLILRLLLRSVLIFFLTGVRNIIFLLVCFLADDSELSCERVETMLPDSHGETAFLGNGSTSMRLARQPLTFQKGGSKFPFHPPRVGTLPVWPNIRPKCVRRIKDLCSNLLNYKWVFAS